MAQEMNFIGRIDIPSTRVSAKMVNRNGVPWMELIWDFQGLPFQGTDEIVLDLEFKHTMETDRQFVGALSNTTGFFEVDLAKFRNPGLVSPRLKVVRRELNGVRKHVGVLDRIVVESLEDDPNSGSILKIVEDLDLKIPWELRIEVGVPILYVSGREELYVHFRYDLKPYFEALVLPEVVRQIFTWLATTSDFADPNTSDLWEKTFARLQVGSEELRNFRKQFALATSGDGEDTPEEVSKRINESATRVSEVFTEKEEFLQKLNVIATEGQK